MSKRIEWIDVSKFIAISIMVAGHIGLPKFLSNVIHVFHMPVFFILAGVVFDEKKHRNFGEYFLLRARQLLVPYICWGMISYMIYIFANKIHNAEYYGPEIFVKELIMMDAAHPVFSGIGIVQWFFPSMFFCGVLSWLIIRMANQCRHDLAIKLIIVLFIIVSTQLIVSLDITNYLGIVSGYVGIGFYLIGNIIREISLANLIDDIKLPHIAIMTLIFGICAFCNSNVNMRIPQVGNSLLFFGGGYSGSIILFYIANLTYKMMMNHKILEHIVLIGQNTAIVLATNRIMQKFVIEPLLTILAAIGIFPHIEIFSRVVTFAIEIISFIPIIIIINKYLPFTLGKDIHRENRKCS